jgi:hypothetical protein
VPAAARRRGQRLAVAEQEARRAIYNARALINELVWLF